MEIHYSFELIFGVIAVTALLLALMMCRSGARARKRAHARRRSRLSASPKITEAVRLKRQRRFSGAKAVPLENR